MKRQPIIESGMSFGPYPEGHCFHIEESKTYKKIQKGLQMAEFMLLRIKNGKPAVWVVEAKSSTPRPETQPNFDDFIAEIREKLVNAFSLTISACLKRQPGADDELPEPFKILDLSSVDFKFVLVIKGHKDDWLAPIKEQLEKVLKSTIKTWRLSPTSVVVLNDNLARKHGLI